MQKIYVYIASCALCWLMNSAVAQQGSLSVSDKNSTFSFPLVSAVPSTIYIDNNDAEVVSIAATALSNDIALVTGASVPVDRSGALASGYAVVIGTIGHSKPVDSIIRVNRVDLSSISNKWESSLIRIIQQPTKNNKMVLLIAGSDRRGTAFGVFELSRRMGVSPFYWWADITPVRRKQLFVTGNYQSGSPSVKYRGIFINDEDWGIQPWAAAKMDTGIKDIGPRTYEKVFELLLRLKANYIWPAMHPCTKAFYYYKENPEVADRYAIVVGGSHCEPMLRNNVFEWAENYEQEYGKKPGEWRYDLNKDEIYKYWDDRVKESVHYESVYTVGMRGVHDGSMPGPKDPDAKMKLLEQVIIDQRKILTANFKEPAADLPQIFVPYKEVLSLYRRGLPLADDITIIWPDDNHGYIRQLPNQTEQKRAGGHGVYYHLSYWGAPKDFLWLSSVSPALINYEMTRAYRAGAAKLWVFNVGDIKPAEMEIQYCMDLAWNIGQWPIEKTGDYIYNWAKEIFGESYSAEIAAIKKEYYTLAQSGKPEHMDAVNFSSEEVKQRLKKYENISARAAVIYSTIDPSLKDAFYELILYPVMGAKLMNEKIFFAHSGNAEKSRLAFDSIAIITDRYNKQIAAGKWDGMMSWHPRDQKVFTMPAIDSGFSFLAAPAFTINAAAYTNKKTTTVKVINDLGIDGSSVTMNTNRSDTSAVLLVYDLPAMEGDYSVQVKCLPDFDTEFSKNLRYGIAVNNDKQSIVNVHAEAETKEWRENVIRGYSVGKTIFTMTGAPGKLYIWLKDKNLVINTIEFYKQPNN